MSSFILSWTSRWKTNIYILVILTITLKSYGTENITSASPDDLSLIASPGSKRILCYGDSLTAGYRTFFQRLTPYANTLKMLLNQDPQGFTQVEIDNYGFCRWTTGDLLNSAEKKIIFSLCITWGPGFKRAMDNRKYDLVILMAGTNDGGTGVSALKIFENLKKMSEMAQSKLYKILHLGIPDSEYLQTNPGERKIQEEVNRLLKEYADQNRVKGVFYYQVPIMYSQGSTDFEGDGLHFSMEGYRKFGMKLEPIVKPLLS